MTARLTDPQRRLWRALYATLRTEQIEDALESVQMDHGAWLAFVDAMKEGPEEGPEEERNEQWTEQRRRLDPSKVDLSKVHVPLIDLGLSPWRLGGPQHCYVCASCSSVWLFHERPEGVPLCEACGIPLEEGER